MEENRLVSVDMAFGSGSVAAPNTFNNYGDSVQIQEHHGPVYVQADMECIARLLQQSQGVAPVSHAMEWAGLNREYYSLFVVKNEEYQSRVFSIPKECALQIHTPIGMLQRFKGLSLENIAELRTMPCIFVRKNEVNERPAPVFLVGRILDIVPQGESIKISFEIFQRFPQSVLEQNKKVLHIASARMRSELCVEHWAIKHCDLIAAFDQMHLQIA